MLTQRFMPKPHAGYRIGGTLWISTLLFSKTGSLTGTRSTTLISRIARQFRTAWGCSSFILTGQGPSAPASPSALAGASTDIPTIPTGRNISPPTCARFAVSTWRQDPPRSKLRLGVALSSFGRKKPLAGFRVKLQLKNAPRQRGDLVIKAI